MKNKNKAIVILLVSAALVGCGYKIGKKEITVTDPRGARETFFACGPYMHISSEGWMETTYEVSFVERHGLAREIYGAKEVAISDMPAYIDAPSFGFDEYTPGDRYNDNPDGTPGRVIENGDVAVRGANQARLMNGKWMPVRIANPAC